MKFEVRGELFYDTDEEEDASLRPCDDSKPLSKDVALTVEASSRAEAERLFRDRMFETDPTATGLIVLPAPDEEGEA